MKPLEPIDVRDLLDRLESALPPAQAVELVAEVQLALNLASHDQRPDGHGTLAALAEGLAHDLNNIFFAIRGSAELIEATIAPDSPIRPYVDIIESVSVRAGELSEELLLFAGDDLQVAQQLALNTAVNQLFERGSSTQGVRLKKELCAEDLRLWIDPSLLRRVMLALIVNAERACESERSKVIIRTGCSWLSSAALSELHFSASTEAGEYVWLEVEDDGVGMSEEVRRQVFNPYFSADSDGRGMGLFIVQGIVRAAGGGGSVFSTPGSGARVRLVFPRCFGDEEEEEIVTDTLHRFRPRALVLVVDDEPEVNLVVSEMLEMMGYEVRAFTSANAAILAYHDLSEQVDIALLDYQMPEMDGASLLRSLRALNPELLAVLMSGHLGHHRTAVDERWSAFLKKPYSMNELLVTLRRVLQRRADLTSCEPVL